MEITSEAERRNHVAILLVYAEFACCPKRIKYLAQDMSINQVLSAKLLELRLQLSSIQYNLCTSYVSGNLGGFVVNTRRPFYAIVQRFSRCMHAHGTNLFYTSDVVHE